MKKRHILIVETQDQCRWQILDYLKGDETFIVVDWAIKFIAMKDRRKDRGKA